MHAIGAIVEESAVSGDRGDRFTDDVCEKISDSEYVIDGKTVTFPVVVADASMLLNAFLVDSNAVQAMLQGSGFTAVELLPGKAILQLLAVDYRNNDLGDYNEAAIIIPVLTPQEKKPFPFFGTLTRMANGSVGNFVYRMPVDQAFTTHAGRYIWGFPKWVSRIDIEFGNKAACGTFIDNDELVFSISAKAGGKAVPKEQRAASLAIRNGKAWKTFGSTTGSDLTFSLGGAMPKIGDSHPLAKELLALGLPKKPMFTVSMKHMAMSFERPQAVNIGEAFASQDK
jgi:hypothetical protein